TSAVKDPEEEALSILLSESPRETPLQNVSPPEPSPPQPSEQEKVRRPAMAPQIPKSVPSPMKSAGRPKPHRSSRPSDSGRSGSTIVINPAVVAGLLMMAGAAIWFFVGLAVGIIYLYPPILFVLGIGAIIRGFTGRE